MPFKHYTLVHILRQNRTFLRPEPTKRVALESVLPVRRVLLRSKRDVGLVTELVRQIIHSGVDAVFALRLITTVLAAAAITALVVAVRGYRIVELIVQIVGHLLQNTVAHGDSARSVLFQQLLRSPHHVSHHVFLRLALPRRVDPFVGREIIEIYVQRVPKSKLVFTRKTRVDGKIDFPFGRVNSARLCKETRNVNRAPRILPCPSARKVNSLSLATFNRFSFEKLLQQPRHFCVLRTFISRDN